jgi:hypothetical protein
MNPFALIFGPLISAGKQLGTQWMEGRQEKHKLNMWHKRQVMQGKIDYNVAAQEGMAHSWKDEWLVIYTCALMTANFIPSLQPHMEAGWTFLQNSTPDWFSYCFVGMYVATFGLKGWKIFKN